jgi:hypothetical protein
MRTQMDRYSIMLVIALLFISSCTPLPTPASTSSNAQPQQTSQSNAPSSNNSSASNTNWDEFLTVDLWVSCIARVLPIAIDSSSGDPAEQILSTNPDADVRAKWAIVPYTPIGMLYTLTSIADSDWIEINKSLNISVSTNTSIPQHVDVVAMQGCGGTQQIRDFPSLSLSTDLKSFTKKSTFSGADFFTLQPGEFEKFNTHFECETPGFYDVSVTVEYSYQGENGVIEFPKFQALCPQSFTVYSIDPGGYFFGAEKYTWKNGKYSQSP